MLLGKPTVRVSGPGDSLLYRENGRKIKIGVQMMPYGYLIDPSTLISWEDTPQQVLNESERRRLANSVRDVVTSQWGAKVGIKKPEG